jgi:hypothetical protein
VCGAYDDGMTVAPARVGIPPLACAKRQQRVNEIHAGALAYSFMQGDRASAVAHNPLAAKGLDPPRVPLEDQRLTLPWRA